MTVDLDELERLANAATPRPWFLAYSAVHSAPATDEYERIEASVQRVPDEVAEALATIDFEERAN